MPRFLIVMSNSAGELDRRTAETPEEARDAVIDIAAGIADFRGGDSILVIDNEPDE